MTTATTPNAVDLLFGRDDMFRWVAEFEVRGRRFTLVPGGCSTLADGYAKVRVWNASGNIVDVKVRETDRLTIVSRYAVDGSIVPA